MNVLSNLIYRFSTIFYYKHKRYKNHRVVKSDQNHVLNAQLYVPCPPCCASSPFAFPSHFPSSKEKIGFTFVKVIVNHL